MTDVVPVHQSELEHEREYVARLYERLDELRAEKERQLARVRKEGPQGSLQNVSERDAFATLYEDRLAQLYAVDDRMVFGRLDMDDGDERYIGRIGLTDEEQVRLMVDWRAPEAGAFYQATAHQRLGVRRRRHLMLRGRTVVDLEDDVLDASLLDEETPHHGAGALLAAVTARRTGQMGDIVATIQSEQDAIIRSPIKGVLVVQGGPGTGKTAVALHRAAYLLYTHRERLKSAGVLLVGPSQSFMRYIDRVLPSLGETGVVMSSLGRLMPGIKAVAEPDRRVAQLKGKLFMADVVANAVANRQRLPAGPRKVDVGGTTLTIRPKQVRRARDRARATGKPHNEARSTFVKIMVRELADQLKDKLEKSSGAGNNIDRSYLSEDVRTSRDVRIALNLCWMPLTPEKLISDLFAKPEQLDAAAPFLKAKHRRRLVRPAEAPWTEADVPLLDEAAELLGEWDASAGRHQASQKVDRQRNLANAEASLTNVSAMLEDFGVDGVVTAEDLADANEAGAQQASAAERAATDRTWTYGHVVVDESQELSPMQWRLLMRRCPMKSFTIVGDIAQASSAAGVSSWSEALEPFVEDRWRLEELTVNYRTPAKITRLAARVAQAAGLPVSSPQAIREGEVEPQVRRVAPGERDAELLAGVAEDLEMIDGGLLAVVVPRSLEQHTTELLKERYGDRVGFGGGGLGQDIVATTPAEAKGLEFDAVVVVEPGMIVEEAGGVVGDLYVAMTRSTQTLRLLSTGDLPAGLD
ncbi:HelD family protein [Citricoccus sp. GCM10030269]|uniref:HelD family protein n=1 Tax=Citricoccus sp. GCM10030269 TaxID=3273388 RepID=UPI00360C96E5